MYKFLTISLAIIFIWSVADPKDTLTWILEASPVIIGVAIVYPTYTRFPLTPLSYILLWVGAVLVLTGAHYTYAEMPLFNYIRDEFNLSRNHYDRFGHFAQGFIPAIVLREVLLRTSPLKKGKWLFIVIIGLCLAKSAIYELAEWLTSAALGQSAHEFLGTQGDEWDAQKDMALALMGSLIALMLLSKSHDKQLNDIRHK